MIFRRPTDQTETTPECAYATDALPEDILFTESLLALSKVGLRAHDGFPAPALVESSSLVLVHQAR